MLFTFEDVEADLSTYLSNWISKSEELWPVYDLYFKPYYQRCLDQETQFLFLTQALEAYHSRALRGNKTPSLEDRLETICSILAQDYRDIIEELLSNSNSISFAKKVAKTRHNLTHHPKKRIPGAISSNFELPEYTWRMQMLLRLCFLVEMKLPPDEIKRLMKSSNEYRELIENYPLPPPQQ